MVKLAPTVRLNSGYDLPVLGLGTFKGTLPKSVTELGDQRKSCNDTYKAVKEAIDAGYRHFDCAMFYENEEEIGDAIREKIAEGVIKREDLFITTKLWNIHHRPDMVEPTCRLSLQKFGLDYVDLYLVHWPTAFKEGNEYFPVDKDGKVIFSNVDLIDTWKAMEDLVAKGLTKSIGVSNYNSEQLKRTLKNAKIPPAVNQVEVSPYLAQKKLIQFCKDQGIVVTAYSPFGNPGIQRPPGVQFKSILENPLLIEVGKKYNKNSAQVTIRYLIQIGTVPLPKSVTPQRIKDNFNVFDFELTPEDMAQIETLDQNERTVLFSEGLGHPEYPFSIEY